MKTAVVESKAAMPWPEKIYRKDVEGQDPNKIRRYALVDNCRG
jgi:hypothetical protein